MNTENTNFKNSGIEWIGEIPKHWGVKKLKFIIENSISGEVIDKGYWNSGNEFLYTCQKEPMFSDFDKFPENKRTRGNCLLLTRNATPYIFIPKDNAIFSNVVQKIILFKKYDKRYIKYSIQIGANSLLVNGDIIPSYNMQVWNNIYFCDIPLDEQERIAGFLDDKCASIDSSIENLEQKTKSLAEYKKALITQCVTKGLNPKILEFKDSGIPWIGQIPKHWEIIRLGYICNKLNRKIDENDEPLICSNKGQVAFRDKNACGKMLSENHTMQGIQVGDIAIHGMDTWHGAIAYSNLKGKITGVVHVCDSKENNKFIVYFLQYLAIQGVYKLISNGVRGNTSDFRSWNSVKNIYIIVPPLNEQKEIAEFIDKKCEKIDNLSANYKEQIKTLKEYKKALIYECVTGKKQI